MMKKKLLTASPLLFAIVLLTTPLEANTLKKIHLKDGSILKGNIIKMDGKAYTIQTENLGVMTIDEERVRSISSLQSQDNVENANTNMPQLQDIQQQMKNMPPEAQAMQGMLLSDPKMMQEVQNMAQDPEIRALLSDPALMNSILSGDLNSIGSNSKAQGLMNNPKMQKLMNKLNEKMSQ